MVMDERMGVDGGCREMEMSFVISLFGMCQQWDLMYDTVLCIDTV